MQLNAFKLSQMCCRLPPFSKHKLNGVKRSHDPIYTAFIMLAIFFKIHIAWVMGLLRDSTSTNIYNTQITSMVNLPPK